MLNDENNPPFRSRYPSIPLLRGICRCCSGLSIIPGKYTISGLDICTHDANREASNFEAMARFSAGQLVFATSSEHEASWRQVAQDSNSPLLCLRPFVPDFLVVVSFTIHLVLVALVSVDYFPFEAEAPSSRPTLGQQRAHL